MTEKETPIFHAKADIDDLYNKKSPQNAYALYCSLKKTLERGSLPHSYLNSKNLPPKTQVVKKAQTSANSSAISMPPSSPQTLTPLPEKEKSFSPKKSLKEKITENAKPSSKPSSTYRGFTLNKPPSTNSPAIPLKTPKALSISPSPELSMSYLVIITHNSSRENSSQENPALSTLKEAINKHLCSCKLEEIFDPKSSLCSIYSNEALQSQKLILHETPLSSKDFTTSPLPIFKGSALKLGYSEKEMISLDPSKKLILWKNLQFLAKELLKRPS